ncbi:3203_t:CDS:2 [Cetraspora pellucida]|uniref:3203_t:CDS:1 n=1 Tax=Cetraspora pellucida TaxID=1433469 RepID=A0ACA9LBD7_9GLOM|nr:3203_t:CDS:2 [Cetraspora pellucida]
MSVGSSSRAVSIVSLENQPCTTKKSKLPKRRRKYIKSSWVWKYFKVSKNGQHDICTVEILNLNNETVKCGYKFLHDGSTGNMSGHLQDKHDLYKNKNKKQDHTVQQTLKETLKRSKVKMHKEPRNQEIRQAITEWIIIDNLSINIVKGKGYKKMMKIVDPAF